MLSKLLDRLRNEITRLPAVKAFATLAHSPLELGLDASLDASMVGEGGGGGGGGGGQGGGGSREGRQGVLRRRGGEARGPEEEGRGRGGPPDTDVDMDTDMHTDRVA